MRSPENSVFFTKIEDLALSPEAEIALRILRKKRFTPYLQFRYALGAQLDDSDPSETISEVMDELTSLDLVDTFDGGRSGRIIAPLDMYGKRDDFAIGDELDGADESEEPYEYTINEDGSQHKYRELLRAETFAQVDTIIDEMDDVTRKAVLRRFARAFGHVKE